MECGLKVPEMHCQYTADNEVMLKIQLENVFVISTTVTYINRIMEYCPLKPQYVAIKTYGN